MATSTVNVSGASKAQAAGLPFQVVDTASNILAGLTSLAGDSNLTAITFSTATLPVWTLTASGYAASLAALQKIQSAYSLVLTGVSAANVASLQANAAVKSFTVSDTAANIAANFSNIAAASKLTALTASDGAAIPITYSQYSNNSATLAKLSGSTVAVSGVGAGPAFNVQGDKTVSAFAIADTAAHIKSAFGGLERDTKLTAIAVTDGGQVTLVYSEYANKPRTVSLMPSKSLVVATAPWNSAQALQSASNVASFNVRASSTEIAANLPALGYSKLTAVTLSDTGDISVSYNQYTSNWTGLHKLPINSLHVTGATTSAVAGLKADGDVADFDVADTAWRIQSNLDLLGGSNVSSLAITDGRKLLFDAYEIGALSGGGNHVLGLLPADSIVVTKVSAPVALQIDQVPQFASVEIRDLQQFLFDALPELEQEVSSGFVTAIHSKNNDVTLKLSTADYNANIDAIKLINADSPGSIVIDNNFAPVTMSAAAFQNLSATQLAAFSANSITITGIDFASAILAGAKTQVRGESVVDTQANIVANLDALNYLVHAGIVTSITASDGFTTPLTINSSQYAMDSDVIALINDASPGAITASATAKWTPGFHLNLVGAANNDKINTLRTVAASLAEATYQIESVITNNIVDTVAVNIGVGQPNGGVPNFQVSSGGADASRDFAAIQAYPDLLATLSANVTGPAAKYVNLLPATQPAGLAQWAPPFAIAQAWGLAPSSGVNDGFVNVGPASFNAMTDTFLHEITETMGRLHFNAFYRYNSPGVLSSTGKPIDLSLNPTGNTYFSIDGGKTALAYYDGDGDFLGAGDPFDIGVSSTINLTGLDCIILGAIGYQLSDNALAAANAAFNTAVTTHHALN